MKKLMQSLLLLCFAIGVGGVVVAVRKVPPAVQAPALPPQGWTTAPVPTRLLALVPGKLPPAEERQLRKDCRRTIGQVLINGACWQLLPIQPPCPMEDGAFEHEDHRCYARVLRAEQSPTSGEPRSGGVADP